MRGLTPLDYIIELFRPCVNARSLIFFGILAIFPILCYAVSVVKRILHGGPAFALRKRVIRMKNDDFIAITGWIFSLLSLLLAIYMLGKGI